MLGVSSDKGKVVGKGNRSNSKVGFGQESARAR